MNSTPNRNVFVNCPFDEPYAAMLSAIIFTIVDCEFIPRCALEKSDASEVRIQKIYRIIQECQYGIHDISRTKLEKKSHLPRFNMPLELGIFLGAKFIGSGSQRAKSCLVFDQDPNRYQMYLSDVAGQDIAWHSNEPRRVVRLVRDWFAELVERDIPTSAFVWDRYSTFLAELRHTCAELKQRPDELTYSDLLRHIKRYRMAYAEKLTLGSSVDTPIMNPSPRDIKHAIRSVKPSDSNTDSFVILDKGANGYTYLQAVRRTDGEWVLEYQDGHLDKHYQAETTFDTDQIIQRFVSFAEVHEDWHHEINWILIDVEENLNLGSS